MTEKLRALSIRARHRDGEQRTLCPRCSHLRKKKNDPCLALKIEGPNARFNCWHCGYKGGVSEHEGGRTRLRDRARNLGSDFGTARRKLRNGVLS